MNILIAVMTCWKYSYPAWVGHPLHRRTDHRMDAMLNTWWPTTKNVEGVEAKLFVGRNQTMTQPSSLSDDVVALDAPDEYDGLKYKLRAMCGWAGDRYDFILKIDDDTAVDVPLLVKLARLTSHHYTGEVLSGYCYGGAGYLLSRRAAEVVATREIAPDPFGTNPVPEDHWVAIALNKVGVFPRHDPSFNSEQGVTLHCREIGLMQRWWSMKQGMKR